MIRDEFGTVKFPSHCGLHAAVAMDDWIDDETVLNDITAKEDYFGEWWDVPEKDLLECMMALCYLDSSGIEFYLPAYMTAIVEKPLSFDEAFIRSSSWQILSTMIPDDSSDSELVHYFHERFSLIRGGKKNACRKFMSYVASCDAYDDHAKENAEKALSHKFWTAETRKSSRGKKTPR